MQPGKRVAVLGSGPVGIITAIVAAAFGADDIVITDVSDARLGFVAQHCPRTRAVVVARDAPAARVAQQLLDEGFGGAAPEVVIDCAGMEQTVQTALRLVAPGGRCVLVGMGQDDVSIPAVLLTFKELDLLGSFR